MRSKPLPIDWKPIRHLVLDFGGVLYQIQHEATWNAFSKLGLHNCDSMYSLGNQSPLINDLECGRASPEAFILSLKNRCQPDTTSEAVIEAWNAVLIGLRPGIIPLLHKLADQFDLILFSNTNALHAKYFEKQILQGGLPENRLQPPFGSQKARLESLPRSSSPMWPESKRMPLHRRHLIKRSRRVQGRMDGRSSPA